MQVNFLIQWNPIGILKDCHHYMNFLYVHLLIHMAESLGLHALVLREIFHPPKTSHISNPLSISETLSTGLATT